MKQIKWIFLLFGLFYFIPSFSADINVINTNNATNAINTIRATNATNNNTSGICQFTLYNGTNPVHGVEISEPSKNITVGPIQAGHKVIISYNCGTLPVFLVNGNALKAHHANPVVFKVKNPSIVQFASTSATLLTYPNDFQKVILNTCDCGEYQWDNSACVDCNHQATNLVTDKRTNSFNARNGNVTGGNFNQNSNSNVGNPNGNRGNFNDGNLIERNPNRVNNSNYSN